ncbi:transposase family Tnp2 protein, partial [Rhizoctonia solani AG-3 Rhs1AP]
MDNIFNPLEDENTPLAGGSGAQNFNPLPPGTDQNAGSQGSRGSETPPPSPEPYHPPYRAPLSPIHNHLDHTGDADFYNDLLGAGPPPPPPPPLGNEPPNEEEDVGDNNMDPFQLDDPDDPDMDPLGEDPYPEQEDMGEDEPGFRFFDEPHGPPAPDDPDYENERPAFMEHPDLRNFYIRTFILSAFKGVTEDAIAEILLSYKAALLAQDSRGELSPELSQGLVQFPLTLRSLRRRLGMNVDRFIRIYALCPSCGTRYSMEEIDNMAGPECPKEWDDEPCNVGLYTESILYGGVRKRSPCKSYPSIPLPGALERFLLRPGAFEGTQSWRRQGHPEDEPVEVPPATRHAWMLNMPINQMFGAVSQGWAFRATPCGLYRPYNEQTGTYEDIPVDGGRPFATVMLPGGLIGSVNFDAFQACRRGKYSVNGVYIMINTLPFHLRIKPENMILVAVMPGPKEPSKYEFDQIMQPFINDLIELSQGMFGSWDNHPELETPAERFDTILARTYLPSHCGRPPPKLAHIGSNVKAEQWHHLSFITPILLFEAWRVGDTIPDNDIPTGPENSKASKDRVQQLQDIPNPSDDDRLTTERVLKAIGGSFEGERQRGMLQAVLAGARFLGQEHIQLAQTGISVNLMEAQYREDYARLVAYCMAQLPGVLVYGDGRELAGGVHLPPNGSVKSFSHVLVLGTRYGNRIPVLIKHIYTIQLVTLDDVEHQFTCAVVQRFQAPQVIPVFPWDLWQRQLAYDSWEYNRLDPPEVISVEEFTGVFALIEMEFTYGHYWITAAMDRARPEPYDP